ncbi:MAG: CDP-alcohol phosphatidyltransferase family protein [Roseburia sp.]|nr:CDP-alcohol phosphatidyltransferase family protein [Roseburia sp.]
MLKSVRGLPNLITTIRIIGAVCLCFIMPLSMEFYIFYTLCGVSDVLDGFIARSMKLTSERGAKLDSIADLVFYAIMLCKLLPILFQRLPKGIWLGVGAILVIRLISYLVVALRFHCFAAVHTYGNKLCGLAVFSVPYILLSRWAFGLSVGVCVIAALAALEELLIHMIQKEYRTNLRCLWDCLRANGEKPAQCNPSVLQGKGFHLEEQNGD